jgi:hypothetical protein
VRAEDLTDRRTRALIVALWKIIEALEARGVVVMVSDPREAGYTFDPDELEIEVPDYVPEAWGKSSDT